MAQKDYYKTLGISKDAVRMTSRAYVLAMNIIRTTPKARRMKINSRRSAAYAVLSDPEKKTV
jgi:DnaJ-class molecular chaperone